MYWLQEIKLLTDVVNKINLSKDEENPVESCKHLYNVFNLLYQEFYDYRLERKLLSETEVKHIEKGKNNNQQPQPREIHFFTELLKQGLDEQSKNFISSSRSISVLVNFNPPIMADKILEKSRYNPENIPDELKEKSSYQHRNFIKAYNKVPRNLNKLFSELARVLLVVRNNLAHYGKTPYGPDRNKSSRDVAVCRTVQPILMIILEHILGFPNSKLGTYGTLKPNNVNHEVLKNIKGDWVTGKVRGFIKEEDGLPFFTWSVESKTIELDLFVSESLQKELPRIDQFEGNRYHRIWIPIERNHIYEVCNIYEKKYKY